MAFIAAAMAVETAAVRAGFEQAENPGRGTEFVKKPEAGCVAAGWCRGAV